MTMAAGTSSNDGGAQRTGSNRWAILAVLFLVATSSHADRAILPILLQPIKNEFGISDSLLGLLGGAPFALCYAISAVPLGFAADRLNRTRLLVAALSLWSVMTALCGLVTTLPMLFAARMGVGVGEAGAMPPAHALIAAHFAPRDRAKAFAIFTAAATAGAILALAGGGLLAARFGWRGAFLGMAAFSIPVLLLAVSILREPSRQGNDATGTPDYGRPSLLQDITVLFGKRSFTLLLAGTTVYALVAYGPISFVPTFMMRAYRLDIATTGLAFGGATVVGTLLGTLLGGPLGDYLARRDSRWLARLPALGLALGLPLALAAFSSRSLVAFLLMITAFSALLLTAIPPVYSAIQLVCGTARRALAPALLMASLNAVGMTFGPLLTGIISDRLVPIFGIDSLRYAMIGVTLLLVPASLLLAGAGQTLLADAED